MPQNLAQIPSTPTQETQPASSTKLTAVPSTIAQDTNDLSWVKNYKTPPEDQWIADPRTGAALSKNSGSESAEASDAPTSSDAFPTAYAQEQVDYRQALLDSQREHQRYKDINSATKNQKLEALKDMSVNPFMLDDGYDALTNALQRWKTMATSPEAAKLSPQEKDRAAENYWKSTLEPIYTQKLKANPVSLETWKAQAYGKALQWNMDKAYNSHWRSGLYAGDKDYENIFLTGLNALGGIIRSDAAVYGKPGMLDKEEIPILDPTIRSLKRAISTDTFWHDINPDEAWSEKSKSFILEQAMMLPLYKATGGFNEGVIGGLTGEAKVPLTQLLAKSNLGSTVTKLLLNGAEGAAYGYTMVDPSEKKNAWQWGVQQAIAGTLFSSAGKSFRLKDVVKPERAAELEEHAVQAHLGTQGFVKDDVEGLREEAAHAISGVSAAGGRPAVLQVVKSALSHLKDTDGLSEEEIRNGIQDNLEKDSPRWKSTYITSAYIRSMLKEQGKNFTSLNKEDVVELRKHLIDLVDRSESRVPQTLAELKNDVPAAVAAQKTAAKPVEQVLDAVERRNKSVDLPSNLRGSKPKYGYGNKLFDLKFEDPRDLAAYVLSTTSKNTKSAAHDNFASYYKKQFGDLVGVESHSRKVRDFIKNLAKEGDPEKGPIVVPSQVEKSKSQFKIPDAPGRLRIRTKYGKDVVSYSANMEWIAEARKRVAAAGLKWNSADISKWLDGLSHEDFVDDLKEFFYPKGLKEVDPELTWEYKDQDTGREYPNFLAFMYNYTDQMPEQFGKKLSSMLEDTGKFERWFDPKQDVEIQKQDYAKGMYAHIQELLASERYKTPNALGQVGNVYQTTYQTMKNPTEYQMMLHKETIEAETALLEKMFKGKKNAQALKHAMDAYSVLATDRFKAFKTGKQTSRIAKQADIDKLIIESSKGKRDLLEF